MSDVIKEIPVPQSGWHVRSLGAPVIALAKAVNGLRKLTFEPSEDSDWHFVWADGGATLKYPPNSGGNDDDTTVSTGSPTPFQFVQVAANTPDFILNPDSYLRANFASAVNTGITGSTAPIPFADGLIVWLQLDTDGSSGRFSQASIQSGQSAPYDGSGDNGTDLMTFTGGGTGPNDPFVWDESYTPLAQVFAADPSGLPVRGGVVYAVDNATPPTQIEVVQLTCTHLALRTIVNGAQAGMMALPDAGPLIS